MSLPTADDSRIVGSDFAGLSAALEAALHDSQETFEFLKDVVTREALDADG